VLRLSIVIPVFGDLKPLDDTLVSILENRPANCELLVVHNAPYNDPYELAGEVQFVQAPKGAGIVECLNLGLSASRAPVVHLLACGVEVRPGWAEVALRHFRNPEVAAVAPVLLHHDDQMTVVSAGLGYRAEGVVWRVGRGRTLDEVGEDRDEPCGPDALAGFYRRSAIEAVGGFSQSPIDTLATIEVSLSLREAGFRCVVEPDSQAKVNSTAARDKVGFRHGRHSERLFWRWASAHGRVRSVAAHAALVAGECVIGLWRPFMLLQLAGRAVGLVHAAMAKPRSKTREEADDEPAVITSPRFNVVDCRDVQSSSRAA
jgi:GT2 family glycosyltransferase